MHKGFSFGRALLGSTLILFLVLLLQPGIAQMEVKNSAGTKLLRVLQDGTVLVPDAVENDWGKLRLNGYTVNAIHDMPHGPGPGSHAVGMYNYVRPDNTLKNIGFYHAYESIIEAFPSAVGTLHKGYSAIVVPQNADGVSIAGTYTTGALGVMNHHSDNKYFAALDVWTNHVWSDAEYPNYGAYCIKSNNSHTGPNDYHLWLKGKAKSWFDGPIGVGTTSPLSNLDVAGNAVIGAAYAGVVAAPANGLLVAGHVGIGLPADGSIPPDPTVRIEGASFNTLPLRQYYSKSALVVSDLAADSPTADEKRTTLFSGQYLKTSGRTGNNHHRSAIQGALMYKDAPAANQNQVCGGSLAYQSDYLGVIAGVVGSIQSDITNLPGDYTRIGGYFANDRITDNDYSLYVASNGKSYFNGNVGIGAPNPTSKLDIVGSVEVSTNDAFYFGDPTTDGTWRIIRSGANLVFQRRESAAWVTKNTMNP